jgi:hypothetical protein
MIRRVPRFATERHRQIVLHHGEEATELPMLVVAVHDRLSNQGVEFGATKRRHLRRIGNRLRPFTSNRQQ